MIKKCDNCNKNNQSNCENKLGIRTHCMFWEKIKRETGYKNFKEGDIVVNPQLKGKRFVIEYRIDSEFIGFVPIEIDGNNVPINNRLSIYTPWDKLELEKNNEQKRMGAK